MSSELPRALVCMCAYLPQRCGKAHSLADPCRQQVVLCFLHQLGLHPPQILSPSLASRGRRTPRKQKLKEKKKKNSFQFQNPEEEQTGDPNRHESRLLEHAELYSGLRGGCELSEVPWLSPSHTTHWGGPKGPVQRHGSPGRSGAWIHRSKCLSWWLAAA